MAHEQPTIGCNHGPWEKGPYGKRCQACGRVELRFSYSDVFERAVRRGMEPFCAICGEAMDEVFFLHFRCKCGFEKRYRPAAVSIRGLGRTIANSPALREVFNETEIADIPNFCFMCDCGAFRRAGEFIICCDWCGLTIKREKDQVVFSASYKSD